MGDVPVRDVSPAANEHDGAGQTDRGQPARPFCDRLCGGVSGPLCRLPAWAGWPMKWSSAWLTSSAWVQMIACGPPAMMVERAFFSSAGSLRPGGLVGQDAILVSVDDQDGDADPGEIAPEVFQAGC